VLSPDKSPRLAAFVLVGPIDEFRVEPERGRLSDRALVGHDFTGSIRELSEAAELAIGATRTEHRHLGRIVVLGIVGEIGPPMTTGDTVEPALNTAKDHSLDLTPSVSAAAARSAIRASPPFIAWAAAIPIIDDSVM